MSVAYHENTIEIKDGTAFIEFTLSLDEQRKRMFLDTALSALVKLQQDIESKPDKEIKN